MQNLLLFSGNANRTLAEQVAHDLGRTLGSIQIGCFADGEVKIEICENVIGQDAFFIQPICAPANDNLMELLLAVDALRRAPASRITAVIPYIGYTRQDRRVGDATVPVSAKLIANLLKTAGVHRLVTIELHNEQLAGFFEIPINTLYTGSLFLQDLKQKNVDPSQYIIISPDIGGMQRAQWFAEQLSGATMIVFNKKQRSTLANYPISDDLNRIAGKHCVIIDDMVDTAKTLNLTSQLLKNYNPKTISAYCTHPVLSQSAVEDIEKGFLDELIVTDTIPLCKRAQKSSKIRVLSVSLLLVKAIHGIHNEGSTRSTCVTL
jgi:ribose-phosphate pyrophosphokinase